MQTAPAPMQTVHRLEAALRLAVRLGYRIRLEPLIGETGGGCEIRGQKWLFVDLSLTPREQLEQVLAALRREAVTIKAARTAARIIEKPRGIGMLRSAESGSAPEPTEASTGREVSAASPKSAQGFLPRWRRWYKMVLGRHSDSR